MSQSESQAKPTASSDVVFDTNGFPIGGIEKFLASEAGKQLQSALSTPQRERVSAEEYERLAAAYPPGVVLDTSGFPINSAPPASSPATSQPKSDSQAERTASSDDSGPASLDEVRFDTNGFPYGDLDKFLASPAGKQYAQAVRQPEPVSAEERERLAAIFPPGVVLDTSGFPLTSAPPAASPTPQPKSDSQAERTVSSDNSGPASLDEVRFDTNGFPYGDLDKFLASPAGKQYAQIARQPELVSPEERERLATIFPPGVVLDTSGFPLTSAPPTSSPATSQPKSDSQAESNEAPAPASFSLPVDTNGFPLGNLDKFLPSAVGSQIQSAIEPGPVSPTGRERLAAAYPPGVVLDTSGFPITSAPA